MTVTKLRIESSSQVQLGRLRELAAELPGDWNLEVDDAQFFMKSGAASPWITILGSAPTWVQILGTGAGLVIGGGLAAMGKHAYENIDKLPKAVANAAEQSTWAITKFAIFISQAAKKAASESAVVSLAVPIGDSGIKANLVIDAFALHEIELLVALFVHHIPGMLKVVEERGIKGDGRTGDVTLMIDSEYSLLMSWFDRKAVEQHQVFLPIAPILRPE